MKRTVFILLMLLACGSACSLHKSASPATDPDAPQPAPGKRLFSLPLPPQEGEDHFFEQNWRNNG